LEIDINYVNNSLLRFSDERIIGEGGGNVNEKIYTNVKESIGGLI